MYEQTGTLIKSKFKEHLVPTILTTMALSLATVVDSIIVGQLLGADALAAVGMSMPIISFLNIIYVLFGVGGMMCASVARGRWEMDKSNRLFTIGILGGAAVMFVFLVCMIIFLKPISMALSGGDVKMASLTSQYLKPLVFTGVALMLSNGVALFMRADGKPNKSAMIVIISNAVNLVLDYILIKFFNTGIMGAGLSTTLGYVVGVFVVLPYLVNYKNSRTFKFAKIKNLVSDLTEVLKTGLPKGCTYIATFFRSIVLNGIVIATLGKQGMTILTVLLNVLTIASVFVSGTGDALLPIVGMLHGERDIYGIRKTVESARNVLATACAVIVVLFTTCSGVIGSAFGLSSAEDFSMLKTALIMFSAYVPFYATCTTLQNLYNITERERAAVVIAICDGFIFVCSIAFILSKINANLIWLCYAFGSLATFILILVMGALIRRKEKVNGILLLRDIRDDEKIWNMTIDANVDGAVGLSEKVVAFCREHNINEALSNKLGLGIEEMAVATSNYAHKSKTGKIDIMIKLCESDIVMRFRDNGDAFDPIEYVADNTGGPITDGIELLKKTASEISYSKQLGFNITVLNFTK